MISDPPSQQYSTTPACSWIHLILSQIKCRVICFASFPHLPPLSYKCRLLTKICCLKQVQTICACRWLAGHLLLRRTPRVQLLTEDARKPKVFICADLRWCVVTYCGTQCGCVLWGTLLAVHLCQCAPTPPSPGLPPVSV